MALIGLLWGDWGTANADFINGDFRSGNLSGWTVFTTPNGTNGTLSGVPLPNVVSFNTCGTGAKPSAHFNVGVTVFTGGEEGGGIFQNLSLSAGTYSVSGCIASENDPGGGNNINAGTFQLLVDGVVKDSVDLGDFATVYQVLRGHLSATFNLGAGSHEFRFLITRHFFSEDGATPQQYLDDLVLSRPNAVPEPATVTLLGIGAAGLLGFGRRRRCAGRRCVAGER
jgi:hypothetical protein